MAYISISTLKNGVYLNIYFQKWCISQYPLQKNGLYLDIHFKKWHISSPEAINKICNKYNFENSKDQKITNETCSKMWVMAQTTTFTTFVACQHSR